jgi:peptidoglycan/xylan/chitin deacetylase (PgdA/CDA1 family)
LSHTLVAAPLADSVLARPDDLRGALRAPLAAFREMRFSFVDLDQGLKLCQSHGFTQPMMTVAVDDGYRTVYENALPILEELGIKGFLYLVDYVDKGRNYRRK